jgi:D-alanine-D-alanine ligase
MEEFNGTTDNEHSACGLIEMLDVPYTGANSKNLLVCRDKSLAKIILSKNNIPTPKYFVSKLSDKKIMPSELESIHYPAIVKCLKQEASTGLSQASIVNSDKRLEERVNWIKRKYRTDVLCEEFIEGKDIYLGAIINGSEVTLLPPWRVTYKNSENPDREIYGEREKWSDFSRRKKGIVTGPLKLSDDKLEKINEVGMKTIEALDLQGYVRIDIRLSKDWTPHVLEVNPNPNIAKDDEFAESARYMGIKYEDLLESITFGKKLKFSKKPSPLKKAS